MFDPFARTPLGDAIAWIYPLTFVLAIGAAIFLVRHSKIHSARPWSAPAVASAALGIVHPSVWLTVLAAARIPYMTIPWVGRGDSELRSFGYSALVITLAIVGGVLVLRSQRKLRGIPFCIVGLITGGYFLFYWLWIFYTFFGAYRGHGGHGP